MDFCTGNFSPRREPCRGAFDYGKGGRLHAIRLVRHLLLHLRTGEPPPIRDIIDSAFTYLMVSVNLVSPI